VHRQVWESPAFRQGRTSKCPNRVLPLRASVLGANAISAGCRDLAQVPAGRPPQALAEAAALLILSKKLEGIFPKDKDEDA